MKRRDHLDIQCSWPSTASCEKEDIHRPRGGVWDVRYLPRGSQSSRLGGTKDDVLDGIMTGDLVQYICSKTGDEGMHKRDVERGYVC